MSQQKATGWKVPLLFCAVMGVAVLGTWLWRNLGKPEVPPLEPGLVAVAQTYHIDLEADPEGKLLRESITNASTGFATHDSKDARLAALIDKSLDMGRFDAACVAAVLLFDQHKREGKLMHIARSAAKDCATLPWGAFAAKAMKDPGVQTDALSAQCPLARMPPALSRKGCFLREGGPSASARRSPLPQTPSPSQRALSGQIFLQTTARS